jgi:hypothetical protein
MTPRAQIYLYLPTQRGWRLPLLENLTAARKRVEGDIERICSRHYFDFLGAVQQLLKVRTDTVRLASAVHEVDDEFSATGEELLKVLNDLEAKKIEYDSTKKSIEILKQCEATTAEMVKANEYIKAGNFYAAVGCVDAIRVDLHNPLLQPIAAYVKSTLPGICSQLLGLSRNDLLPWFAYVRENNQLIGSTVLRRYAQLILKQQQLGRSSDIDIDLLLLRDAYVQPVIHEPTSLSVHSVQSRGRLFPQERWASLSPLNSLAVPRDYFETPKAEGLAALDQLTLEMVRLHRALHIHGQLQALEAMLQLYREYRDPIVRQYLVSPNLGELIARNGFENTLPDVLARVCGFFTIELVVRDHCFDYASGVYSVADLKELWNYCCAEIESLCKIYSAKMNDPNNLLQVKEELLLITEAMNDATMGFSAGFSTGMLDVAVVMWPFFEAAQSVYVKKAWIAALNKTAYQPMHVASEEIFKSEIKKYALDEVRIDSGSFVEVETGAMANLDALEESFSRSLELGASSRGRSNSIAMIGASHEFIPYSLPFSSAVPVAMEQIHAFIARYFVYASHVPQLGPMGPSVCNSLESVLGIMAEVMDTELFKEGDQTALSKACQISIDAAALAQAVINLGYVLSETLSLSQWSDVAESTLHTSVLNARNKFLSVASRSYEFILELLLAKVDDLLGSLCFVNWEASTLPIAPHDEVKQIIEYLRVTLMWLTHLPKSVRESAHFTSCKRISSGVMDFITSPRVARISVVAIANLDLDVANLYAFADSCGLPQLRKCFDDLRDLVKAIFHPKLMTFDKDIALRNATFPLLDPLKLSQVIEKIIPSPPNISQPSHLPTFEKKQLTMLAKKLAKPAK